MNQLPAEIFNNNRLLTLPAFCEMMKIKRDMLLPEMPFIEYAYNKVGGRIISLYHIRTMKWMLYRILNNILPIIDCENMVWVQYKELAELLKMRINKVERIDQKVFSPARRQRYEIW